LRAQDPAVIRSLRERYSALVFRVLPLSLRGTPFSLEDAAEEVFQRLFRWGPSLPPDSNLKVFVVRALNRTVERLSTPPRVAWARRKDSRITRERTKFTE
jgi:DNA-directed RNA polymerase specialized sigma24 family protein